MVKHPSVLICEMMESYLEYLRTQQKFAPNSSTRRALERVCDDFIDYIFDVMGFPVQSPEFDRDFLLDTTLINPSSRNHHEDVDDYLEYLYQAQKKLEQERPYLFQ